MSGLLFCPRWLVDPDKAALLLVVQCQRQRAVAFERDDEVLVEVLAHKGQVLLRGKPTVRQHVAVFQLVLAAGLEHPAQHVVLGHLAFALDLPGRQVAIKM